MIDDVVYNEEKLAEVAEKTKDGKITLHEFKLTKIPQTILDRFVVLDLYDWSNIKSLDLSHTHIRVLKLSYCPELYYLVLPEWIEKIEIDECNNLQKLKFPASLRNISILRDNRNTDNIQISRNLAVDCPFLEWLVLSCTAANLRPLTFWNLTFLSVQYTNVDALLACPMPSLKTLELMRCDFNSYDVKLTYPHLSNLTIFDCYFGTAELELPQLRKLEIKDCWSLETIKMLPCFLLETLEIINCPALTTSQIPIPIQIMRPMEIRTYGTAFPVLLGLGQRQNPLQNWCGTIKLGIYTKYYALSNLTQLLVLILATRRQKIRTLPNEIWALLSEGFLDDQKLIFN